MAHARFELGFVRLFDNIPTKDRPQAIALYWRAVMHSAEMLSDGEVSTAAMADLAAEIGVEAATNRARNTARLTTLMAAAGLFEQLSPARYRIVHWPEHHSSKTKVEETRIQAADRQRKRRGQDQLPGILTAPVDEVTRMSQRDKRVTPVSRARDRAGDSDSDRTPQTPLNGKHPNRCARCVGGLAFKSAQLLEDHLRNVHDLDPAGAPIRVASPARATQPQPRHEGSPA